jgi:hypothetical protein
MKFLIFSDYFSAKTKLDEFNTLAGLDNGDNLTNIYVNNDIETWAFSGTDCIDNGGLGRTEISFQVNGMPGFNVNYYQDIYDLGYTLV